MGALGRKLRNLEGGQIGFWCPGCEEMHAIRVVPDGNRVCWSWNQCTDVPTFEPSILVRSGHYAPGHSKDTCWCTYKDPDGKPAKFKCVVCHSFVRNGNIEFLSDCTHKLAGKTVPLPSFPGNEEEAGDPTPSTNSTASSPAVKTAT